MSRRSTLATTTGAGGRPPEPPAIGAASLVPHPDRKNRTAVRGKNKIDDRSRSLARFMPAGSRTSLLYIDGLDQSWSVSVTVKTPSLRVETTVVRVAEAGLRQPDFLDGTLTSIRSGKV